MHRMSLLEAIVLLKNAHFSDRNLWEGIRLLLWQQSCIYSEDKPDIREVMNFPWDEETDEEKRDSTSIADSDIERLKKLAKRFEK